MLSTGPRLPRQLVVVPDFGQRILQDETISEAQVDDQILAGVTAKSVALAESRLTRTSFTGAKLERTHFRDCIFSKCDFTASELVEASWHRIVLQGARASGLQIQNSTLKDVIFENCKLDLVNFRLTKLNGVRFKSCDLTEADFYSAQLDDVVFENCQLNKVEFSAAKLKKVDLRTSEILTIRGIDSLGGAIIDSTQLMALAPALAAQYKITVED